MCEVSLCIIWFRLIADPELDNVETQVVRHKPEGLDALCRLTNFTRKELQIMYRGFKQVRCNITPASFFLSKYKLFRPVFLREVQLVKG